MRNNLVLFVIAAAHVIIILCGMSCYYKYERNTFTSFKTSNNTLVSVIVPVYNSEKYLKPFLDSIFKQTLSQIEYIFVDDLGSDNSIPLIKDYISTHKITQQVQFLHNYNNKGPGPSRNAGLAIAKGEYVCFVDPDDWVSKRYFEDLYAATYTESGARYDVTKGGMVKVENMIHKFSKDTSIPVSGREPYVFEQFTWQHFTGMFRRDMLMKHQDARYGSSLIGEDIVFLVSVGFYAKNISFVDKAKYYYRVRRKSLSNGKKIDFYKNDLKSMKETVDFYFKHIKPDGTADELAVKTLGKLKKWGKKINKLHEKTRDEGYLYVLNEYAKLEVRLKSFLNGTVVY